MLRLCNTQGRAVVPQGGLTGLVDGITCAEGDVVIVTLSEAERAATDDRHRQHCGAPRIDLPNPFLGQLGGAEDHVVDGEP